MSRALLPFYLLAAPALAVAALIALYVVRGLPEGGTGVIGLMLDRGGVPAGMGLGWAVVAPVLLLAGLVLAGRALWLWVAVVVVELIVLLSLWFGFRDYAPDGTLAAIACYGLLAAASVLVAVAARPTGPRPATAGGGG